MKRKWSSFPCAGDHVSTFLETFTFFPFQHRSVSIRVVGYLNRVTTDCLHCSAYLFADLEMVLRWLNGCALLFLWVQSCISTAPVMHFIPSGCVIDIPGKFVLDHLYHPIYSQNDLLLMCASQCIMGSYLGTVFGSCSAYEDAQSGHLNICHHCRADYEFLKNELSCDCVSLWDFQSFWDCGRPPKMCNYFCCLGLTVAVAVDCCTYTTVALLHDACVRVRTRSEGEFRPLLGEMH